MGDFGCLFVLSLLQTAGFVLASCFFAFGGAIIGAITGAINGQTTEIGFFRGAIIGVVSGAIVALELLDSFIIGCFLSNIALFGSIVSGKAFMEWVCPAVLKAYQWQTDSYVNDIFDIYEFEEEKGLSLEMISELPAVMFHQDEVHINSDDPLSCTICLQNQLEGERVRVLPMCGHMYHLLCIDEWLLRKATCPICRKQVKNQEFQLIDNWNI